MKHPNQNISVQWCLKCMKLSQEDCTNPMQWKEKDQDYRGTSLSMTKLQTKLLSASEEGIYIKILVSVNCFSVILRYKTFQKLLASFTSQNCLSQGPVSHPFEMLLSRKVAQFLQANRSLTQVSTFLQAVKLLVMKTGENLLFPWVKSISKHRWPQDPHLPLQLLKLQSFVSDKLISD